ncbi:MAG: 2-oxoglutarate dehydrogenase complex dihydrolipoyllysine-residue succinyltransferase [Gammaproteobacteria bacterium]
MATEIKAPQFPESVADGTIATWHKKVGEPVARDELIVDIETDKVVLEVVAPADGVLTQIVRNAGDTVKSQELLALFEAGGAATAAASEMSAVASVAARPGAEPVAGPAARKAAAEAKVDLGAVQGTGRGGRVTKEDVRRQQQPSVTAAGEAPAGRPQPSSPVVPQPLPMPAGDREERRVPMTRLRKRVAERLVEAQATAAMLTTFNEVNMKPVMDMRKNYQAQFEKMHGVKLGFMSFFVRAVVESLKRFPSVNASIDGDDIVYHGYYDIGIAVSSDRGLVVPILRDANNKGFAEIESNIISYGQKAREGKLAIEDMTGGTFSITNGGVFGSLLSTPILNPPQTAILGMHKIQDRPMAVNGQVVILPMMYLALTYDHRLIDGKEAVSFLVSVKDLIEDPARLLLDL